MPDVPMCPGAGGGAGTVDHAGDIVAGDAPSSFRPFGLQFSKRRPPGSVDTDSSRTAPPKARSIVDAVDLAVHRSRDLTLFEAVDVVVPRYRETRVLHPGDECGRFRHTQAVVGMEPLVAVAERRQARDRDRPPLAFGRGAPLVEREEGRERFELPERRRKNRRARASGPGKGVFRRRGPGARVQGAVGTGVSDLAVDSNSSRSWRRRTSPPNAKSAASRPCRRPWSAQTVEGRTPLQYCTQMICLMMLVAPNLASVTTMLPSIDRFRRNGRRPASLPPILTLDTISSHSE